MKKDIAIIGLGTFGFELAVQLTKRGNSILAIDIDEKKVNNIRDLVSVAVQADITDKDVLKQLEINKFDMVVFGMSSALESIILAITHLKKMGVKYIVGKANTRIKKEILLKIGADEVILPEIGIAKQLAEKISNPSLLEKIKIDDKNTIMEVSIPKKFIGKSLRDLDLRKKYDINVILKKTEKQTQTIIEPEELLQKGEIIVVIGNENTINRVFTD